MIWHLIMKLNWTKKLQKGLSMSSGGSRRGRAQGQGGIILGIKRRNDRREKSQQGK